jgi:hypothetical protein
LWSRDFLAFAQSFNQIPSAMAISEDVVAAPLNMFRTLTVAASAPPEVLLIPTHAAPIQQRAAKPINAKAILRIMIWPPNAMKTLTRHVCLLHPPINLDGYISEVFIKVQNFQLWDRLIENTAEPCILISYIGTVELTDCHA